MKRTYEPYIPWKLYDRLSPIRRAPLTLVTAGSGFGKTTAISHFLEHCLPGQTVSRWYTCFGGTPAQIWSDICTLFTAAGEAAAARLQKLEYPGPDNLGHLALLANELTCTLETYLVIDNYQLTGFPEPYAVLDALADHRCPLLHLIIITQPITQGSRYSPANPRIWQVGQESFCFETEDILKLFARRGLPLSADQAGQLYAATEGWVAPLRLHLAGYQAGGEPEVYLQLDQLMEQVFWKPLNSSEQQFFMSLSQLDTFSRRQAAIVMGTVSITDSFWGRIRSNAFIRSTGKEYILHSLFREYLQEKLAACPADFRLDGRKRAGDACLAGGRYRDAFLFFLDALDDESALAVPLTSLQLAGLVTWDSARLEQLLARCPDGLLAGHWEFLLSVSIKASLIGKIPLAAAACRRLEILLNLARLRGEPCRRLNAAMELIRSFQAYNDVEEMCRHHRAVIASLEQPDNFYITNDSWTFCAPSPVFMFWRSSGQLEVTCRMVAEGIPRYASLSGGKGTGAPETMEAEHLLLAGDIQRAEIMAHRAFYLSEQAGQDSLCFCADLLLCRIALLCKDTGRFNHSLESIRRRAFSGMEFCCVTASEMCLGFLYSILNLEELVPGWLRQPEAIRRQLYPVAAPFAKIILARSIRRAHPARLLGLLDQFEQEAEHMHVLLPRIYFSLERAVISRDQGHIPDALNHLRRALWQAAPDQVYLPFAEYYGELSGLLEMLTEDQTLVPVLEQVRRLGRKQEAGSAAVHALLYPGTSPLTPREREIALLARQRLTTQEMALRLSISPATVKNTLYKIYSKLNIHCKRELEGIDF